jgi:multimeric flavodoxin WrbA
LLRAVAVNGYPRTDGNTARLLKIVLAELDKEGIETELLQTAGRRLNGCLGCYRCEETKDRRCAQKDDGNLFIDS